jgi:hypothetical protein
MLNHPAQVQILPPPNTHGQLKGEFMTNEDKMLICDYMGWKYQPKISSLIYELVPNGNFASSIKHRLDSNDASLVAAEIQKRGEWVYFLDYTELNAYGAVIWYDFISKLFNAENFFKAFCEWRKK